VLAAISSGERWYRSLSRQEQHALADVFRLRLSVEGPKELAYAWMENGRHVYFTLEECGACGGESVAAIDFYEIQPARYIGVLQGFVSCSTSSEVDRE
jgi:hypothetical protein